jgi:glycosyltransferase involved in cell wall biosynthesis
MQHPRYSIVVPVYNEAEVLGELFCQLGDLMSRLDGETEVVLVDDGSRDASFELMQRQHERDARYRVLRLSRNFGHQLAITAGLDHADGDAVVIMDADLQDPPEVVLEMTRRWHEGYLVVYGVRDRRAGEGPAKRLTARWFYRLLNRLNDLTMPLDTGDFRLVDRTVLDVVRDMREQHRYLRGMFAWIGFDQAGVQYIRPGRQAGATKFSFRRMLNFAADGLLSFSAAPLRIAMKIGFVISTVSFLAGFAAIVSKLTGVYTTSGWASIAVAMTFLGGVQLTVLGLVGEYIARIYDEVKQRPLYLVREELRADGARWAHPAVGRPGRSVPERTSTRS